MPKRIIQDIIPPEKRTIRHISLPKKKSAETFSEKERYEEEVAEIPEAPQPKKNQNRKKTKRDFSRFGLWSLVFVCIVVLIFSISILFGGATMTIVPHTQSVPIDLTVVAKKSSSANLGADDLVYELIALSKEGSAVLPATGEANSLKKASGTIIIYNNYSTASQRLIKNTRFETPQGLIYRLQNSVVVPGKTTTAGKEVPGSIEALVVADSSGPEYNIGLTDFTIPGFKGDPRFSKFYGRSKTAITGGFSGMIKTVDSALEKTTIDQIRADIESELKAEVNAQKPPNYTFYNDGLFILYESLPQTSSGNEVTIRQGATSSAVIFDTAKLVSYLAKRSISNFDGASIEIQNLPDLSFVLQDKDIVDPNDGTITFIISGTAHVVWIFDEAKLKNDLASQPKKSLDSILRTYPSIEKTEVVIRPFWKSIFPKDYKKIKIKLTPPVF